MSVKGSSVMLLYHYALLAASLLCLAKAKDGELNFVVLGDWGGQPEAPYTTDAEREVAEQMGITAATVGSQFTLALGDNFYDVGVKDVHDPRFQETFEVSTMLDLFRLPPESCCHYVHRKCLLLRLCSRGGMSSVEIMTTMAMPQQRWSTPSCPSAGICLTYTTLR